MNSTAGIVQEASGGVTGDEQDRRPEAPAGPRPSARILRAKAVNRRRLLMVFYPVWLVVMVPCFAVLWLAGWWEDL